MRHILALVVAGQALAGCFTGVESTPRISDSEVRRQKIRTTPEQTYLASVTDMAPAMWQRGKRFHVTDNKIAIIFTPGTANTDSLAGSELTFLKFAPVGNITGTGATDVLLTTTAGDTVHYVVDIPMNELRERQRLQIPFTVEHDVIVRADSLLRGNTYYITTATWFNADDGQAFNGLRHVPVKVDSVTVGTDNYPLAVDFTQTESHPEVPAHARVYMTYGNDRSATRNFFTVFSFQNPRNSYPDIKDATWQRIIHSEIELGMTRDECRLALGAPPTVEQIPTTAGMVERWRYNDGVFLVFEDGYLARFRK